jgi:hypothetical protein
VGLVGGPRPFSFFGPTSDASYEFHTRLGCGFIRGRAGSEYVPYAGLGKTQRGYVLMGFIYWLMITAILGAIFTAIIGAIQRIKSVLSLVTRATIGGMIGMTAALIWVFIVRINFGDLTNPFSKGIVAMIISSGIVSGILGGPIKKKV